MCLYPQLIRNPKYKVTKKNGGQVPPIKDKRVEYVPIGCGKCMECMKMKAREWKVRLSEEIKTDNTGMFITLTFSNEKLAEVNKYIEEKEQKLNIEKRTTGYNRDNKIVTQAVRWWLENIRKKTKKSIKHWLITELGQQGTENIHVHGIIWGENIKTALGKWNYGYTFPRTDQEIKENYVNERTISYITKYVTKVDAKHKNYQPRILTSKGIGKNYIKSYNKKLNEYTEGQTDEAYKTRQGYKMGLPIYYRNKIYTDEQKEKLWLERLDKNVRYVNGVKIDVTENYEHYNRALKEAQELNKQMGYGGGEYYENKEAWTSEHYENQRRDMLRQMRTGGHKDN